MITNKEFSEPDFIYSLPYFIYKYQVVEFIKQINNIIFIFLPNFKDA